jgi:hypothetical protein
VIGWLLLLVLLGCEQERRVPYIPPDLKNWPEIYRGETGLRLEVFVTGWVSASSAFMQAAAGSRKSPVLAFAIHHPRQGTVLFGTGLSHSVAEERDAFPGGLLSLLVRASALEGQDLPTQLRDAGIDPDGVRWVVLSTLRFDQTGELERFAEARVVVARAEHEHAREGPTGYSKRDFDDVSSWRFIDFPLDAPLATFSAHVDLFDDGSCLLIEASGYTPGTMALLLRLPSGPVLLAGGLAESEETARYAKRPRSAFDMDRWWDRIWRLKRFRDLDPRLRILPGYDAGPIWQGALPDVVLHDFTPPPVLPQR